jgi:hypothetical protein
MARRASVRWPSSSTSARGIARAGTVNPSGEDSGVMLTPIDRKTERSLVEEIDPAELERHL